MCYSREAEVHGWKRNMKVRRCLGPRTGSQCLALVLGKTASSMYFGVLKVGNEIYSNTLIPKVKAWGFISNKPLLEDESCSLLQVELLGGSSRNLPGPLGVAAGQERENMIPV